jgi:hypothetical protein
MYRIILLAAVAALCGATAAAQGADEGRSAAVGHEKGSTGPTFPIPGADTLIAEVPPPAGVNVDLDGRAMPMRWGGDPANSGGALLPTDPPGPTR